MNFGNNIEKMAFEKGEWPVVEIMPLIDGLQTIYMGKPPHSRASDDEPGWIIKRIEIWQDCPVPGGQIIYTMYARGPENIVCWDFRHDYEYLPL